MFHFTICDVLWLTVLVALGVSQIVMLRKLRDARSEIESVRKQFGYLRIDDPNRIYVARIGPAIGVADRHRLHIPPGHRFLLHPADTQIPDTGPANPQPTRTLSMNFWREGADVVLQWAIYDANTPPRFEVSTDAEPLFNYQ